MRSLLQMETFSKARLHCIRVKALVVAQAPRDLGQMTHPNSVVVFQGNLCVRILWQMQRCNLRLVVANDQTVFLHVWTYFIHVQTGVK